MNMKDKSTIQRMLGKIEGVAFVVDDNIATPLLDAIEVIDAVLERGRCGVDEEVYRVVGE